MLKALGADGAPLFDGAVKPTGMPRFDRVEEMSARAVFDVPPGPLQLQMSIEDDATQDLHDVRKQACHEVIAATLLSSGAQVRFEFQERTFTLARTDPGVRMGAIKAT